jgi:hypothetical protein
VVPVVPPLPLTNLPILLEATVPVWSFSALAADEPMVMTALSFCMSMLVETTPPLAVPANAEMAPLRANTEKIARLSADVLVIMFIMYGSLKLVLHEIK